MTVRCFVRVGIEEPQDEDDLELVHDERHAGVPGLPLDDNDKGSKGGGSLGGGGGALASESFSLPRVGGYVPLGELPRAAVVATGCRICGVVLLSIFCACFLYSVLVTSLMTVAPTAATHLPLSTLFWTCYPPPPRDTLALKLLAASEIPVAQVLRLESGQVHLELKGTPQPGVTPDMMRWMFQNLDGVVRFGDLDVPLWWLVHPQDNVMVWINRGNTGRPISVTPWKVLGRNPFNPINLAGGHVTATIPDQAMRSGIRWEMRTRILPLLVVSQSTWSDTDVQGRLTPRLGITVGFEGCWSFMNLLLRLVPTDVFASQLVHSVAEVSILHHFLPELYGAVEDPLIHGKHAWDVRWDGYDTSYLEKVKDDTLYTPPAVAAAAVNFPVIGDSRRISVPEIDDAVEWPNLEGAVVLKSLGYCPPAGGC